LTHQKILILEAFDFYDGKIDIIIPTYESNMISAELTIVPVGTCETSISKYIAAATSALEDNGVKYEVTGMGTLIETNNPEKLFSAIQAAHESLFKEGVKRVETHVKIDDRRDVEKTMKEKVGSVERQMGK